MVARTRNGHNSDLDGCPYCSGDKRFFGGFSHYQNCPFGTNPVLPKAQGVPPRRIDPWLLTEGDKKALFRELLEGKWRKTSDGMLEEVNHGT